MKIKAVSGIMLTLLLIGMLTLAFNIQQAKASGTIYIRADGSVDPSTAPIERDGNLYTLTNNIYDSIVIERSNIIIDGNGYTLQASGTGCGFSLTDINNVTIKNTNIKGFDKGIWILQSSGVILRNNSITGNNYNFGVWGYLNNHYIHDIDVSNTVDGKPIYYWVNQHNKQVPTHAGYVTAVNSVNITVKDMNIKNNRDGVKFVNTTNSLVTNCTISNNLMYGISVFGGWSNNITITGNSVTNNEYGIGLYGSSGSTISHNTLINDNTGIDVVIDNSTISNNTIISSRNFGIYLGHSGGNMLYSNTISASGQHGIVLYRSSGNTIYHNNFINNIDQIYLSESFNNVWDDGYPSGGNYWSDYSGVDEKSGPNQDQPGSDGIGDTPYIIDGNNQDNYPLLDPWVERKVGVKAGDWAEYEFEFTWSSTDPNEQPPPEIVDVISNLEWYRIEVLDVSGTAIEFQQVGHFKNGTETKYTWIVDVSTGLGNGTYQLAFISADLSAGHRLYAPYPGQPLWCGWLIRETIPRTYVNELRETNHLNVTDWSFFGWEYPPESKSTDDFYWDLATGIISERLHQQGYEREGYVTSFSLLMKIVDTNLWGAPPTVVATADVVPNTLNLKSEGKWITCYIELPEGYNVSDIDIYSIMLNNTFPVSLLPNPPVPVPTEIGDYDDDGIPDLMVKFNRTELTSYIYNTLGITYGNLTLTVTGNLTDGTPFEGSDTIRVIFVGDINDDGSIDSTDLGIFGVAWSNNPHNPDCDFNSDGVVDSTDYGLLATNYGATIP